ncbi:MAG: LytTR family transcriptional regulator [Deinococcales bacterium]|nr:LytTR family transcriptional regulator [Chitinophagaceae bacterium]
MFFKKAANIFTNFCFFTKPQHPTLTTEYPKRNFLRVHRQYLINLNQIKKYVRGEGNYLIMNNDANIPVARNKKEKLIEKFGWL